MASGGDATTETHGGPSRQVQLRTILEENHHPFLIVEHDPLLNERAGDIAGRVAEAMKQASKKPTILLYSLALDRHLEDMGELGWPGILLL